MAAYRAAGDVKRQAYALENLGTASQLMKDPGRALGYFEESLTLARRVGETRTEISVLGKLGQVARAVGDNARAVAAFGDMLARAEAAGDRDDQAFAAGNLGRSLLDAGQPTQAVPPLRRAASLFHQAGKRADEGAAWFFLGKTLARQEDYLGATDAFQQAAAAAREVEQSGRRSRCTLRARCEPLPPRRLRRCHRHPERSRSASRGRRAIGKPRAQSC